MPQDFMEVLKKQVVAMLDSINFCANAGAGNSQFVECRVGGCGVIPKFTEKKGMCFGLSFFIITKDASTKGCST